MKLIARILTFSFLHFTLGIFILAATLAFVATDRDTIKSVATEAGVYSDIVPALIDNFQEEESKQESEGPKLSVEGPDDDKDNTLSFNDPEIQKIFEDSITSEILQTEFEGLLDDVYAWLEGERTELTFEINLSQVRTNLIENMTTYITARTDSLPECTSIEQASQDDVFNLECKPPGFSAASARSDIDRGVTDFEIFKDPKITQDTINSDKKDDKDAQTFEEQLEPIKNVYSRISPGFYGISALFFGAIVVFLLARTPIGNALTALGKNFFASGLFLAIVAFVAKLVLPGRLQALAKEEGELATLGTGVAEVYIDTMLTFTLTLVLLIAAIGLVLIVPHHLKKLTAGSKHKK